MSRASWFDRTRAAALGPALALLGPALALLGPALALLGCAGGGGATPGDGGDGSSGAATTASGDATAGVTDDGSETLGTDGGDDPLPPPSCDSPEVACGQLCADLQVDPDNCGGCGISCVLPHAIAGCGAGECALDGCELGWADCDDAIATGCETSVACNDGSSCATSCGTSGVMSCADVCAPQCVAPAELCNAVDDDCDGVCDQGPLPGCRVGVQRAIGGIGHFYTANPAEVAAAGLTLEIADFFFVYPDGVDGLLPLFRCIKPGTGGRRFLTSSIDCEGTAAPELTLGFVSPDNRCGAVELYRLYAPGGDDHFYTTSAAERDNAIAMYGYQDQGVVGFVFTGP